MRPRAWASPLAFDSSPRGRGRGRRPRPRAGDWGSLCGSAGRSPRQRGGRFRPAVGCRPREGRPCRARPGHGSAGTALPCPASQPPAGAASRRSPSESRAAPPGGGRLSRRGPRGLASCAGRSRGPSDCDCAETEAAARCRPHARGGGNVFPGAIAVSTRFFLCLKRLLTQYLKIRMCLIRCFTGIYQLISWPLTCV